MPEWLSDFDPTSLATGGGLALILRWAYGVGLQAAIVFVEAKSAKAEADKEKSWEDIFWPKILKRLDAERHRVLAEQKRKERV